jgi:hypothetical protein
MKRMPEPVAESCLVLHLTGVLFVKMTLIKQQPAPIDPSNPETTIYFVLVKPEAY